MGLTFSRIISTLIALLMFIGQATSYAQNEQSTQPPPLLSAAEIEQLVAPVALYPDALLAQVLMAATYPIQVVNAARWRATQPKNLSDRQLSALTQDKTWDPSVKSLTAFPSVLEMMNENLDWTSDLGNAFLDQQQDVMDAVQRLRIQAQAAGNLQSGPQQTVNVSGNPPIVIIQPTHPDIVYVPVYNPSMVYGAWPYPSYPPYYWQPPYYSPGPTILGFTVGLFVGNALWGSMDWHRRHVYINVNRYNTYNHTHITSNQWRRPPESHRGRAADHRRNRGQHNLSGPGAGFDRSQRPIDMNRSPGASRPAITGTRPDGARPDGARPNTQGERPRTRPGAADQRTNSMRPNLPNVRPDSSRPNLPNTRQDNPRPNATTELPSNPRNGFSGDRRNNPRPNASGERPSAPRSGAATERPGFQRPAAAPQPQTAPRPTVSPERPTFQRPAAVPERPNIQRPAAAPERPAFQRPAAPERPAFQRPAAPERPSFQRPAAAPERQSAPRPAAAPERRDGTRDGPSRKHRGEGE